MWWTGKVTFGTRFFVSLAIVLAALFGLSLCGYNYWEPRPQDTRLLDYMLASAETHPELCVADEETKERLRGIMIEALDEGLREHIKNLYIVWMKDERGQPGRARVGVEAAIRAHQIGRKAALEWAPPRCGTG